MTAGDVILVTGGAGFLGKHIVRLLQEKATDVKEIRIFDTKPFVNDIGIVETKPVKSLTGDIRQMADVENALQGVDVVIHTAGLISFGTLPDCKGMEEVNVKGTSNLVEACIKHGVKRLIYTSTIDVVIGYDDIRNGNEQLPVPKCLLFPGYPETKHRAEQLVLQAHGRKLMTAGKNKHEDNHLRTLALRPNVMYGEGDPYYVSVCLSTAKANGGIMQRVGDGSALFQQAYVGNMAWAHLKANEALARDGRVGGQAYFVTDNTPIMNTFDFMKPFLEARGYSLSSRSVPYPIAYAFLWAREWLLWLIRPFHWVNHSNPLCSLIYVNKSFFFDRSQAEKLLDYHPLYDFSESLSRSLPYYCKMK